MDKTCEVRIYKGRCDDCEERRDGCDKCRIGCWNPARYRNPFFGWDDWHEQYWWRGMYGQVEWLCAKCYDDMIRTCKQFEELYRDFQGGEFEENPKFTAILEKL